MSNYNVIVPHYSVMLADSLSSIIQEQYPFKHRIKMELLSAKMNDIYRVHSDDYQYYLRIPRHERFWPYELTHYHFEMGLANFLRKEEIQVSYPIPTTNKSFLGILNAPEGVRYFSLHTEATGTLPDTNNIEHMKLMGTYLANLHNTSQGYKSNYTPMRWDFDLLLDYGMNKLQKYIADDLKSNFARIHKKAQDLIEEFHRLIPAKTSNNWGIIHGNYVPKNLRLENNQLTLFDFEYCGMGYYIFDMAFMIHKTNLLNLNNRPFQTFLQSYQEIRSITDNEMKALQIMAKLALVSRMTRTSGMRDLVGTLWFDEQVRSDMAIVEKLL